MGIRLKRVFRQLLYQDFPDVISMIVLEFVQIHIGVGFAYVYS
jgi:hypothetical protein